MKKYKLFKVAIVSDTLPTANLSGFLEESDDVQSFVEQLRENIPYDLHKYQGATFELLSSELVSVMGKGGDLSYEPPLMIFHDIDGK